MRTAASLLTKTDRTLIYKNSQITSGTSGNTMTLDLNSVFFDLWSEPLVLPWAIGDFVKAVNKFDGTAVLKTFKDDALVNDVQREFFGKTAIGKWVQREIVTPRVTITVIDIREHYDDYIVTAIIDGAFDKTNLPDSLVLTFYFTLRGDEIARLIILRNKPAV
jgi:hypothetical protein